MLMKQYIFIVSLLSLSFLTGCAPMQASVPQQTANIGGMQSTANNPIESPSMFSNKPTPMENASKMISY